MFQLAGQRFTPSFHPPAATEIQSCGGTLLNSCCSLVRAQLPAHQKVFTNRTCAYAIPSSPLLSLQLSQQAITYYSGFMVSCFGNACKCYRRWYKKAAEQYGTHRTARSEPLEIAKDRGKGEAAWLTKRLSFPQQTWRFTSGCLKVIRYRNTRTSE